MAAATMLQHGWIGAAVDADDRGLAAVAAHLDSGADQHVGSTNL